MQFVFGDQRVRLRHVAPVSAAGKSAIEHEVAHPRSEQLVKLASLRGLGKREAAERLKPLRSTKDTIRRKT